MMCVVLIDKDHNRRDFFRTYLESANFHVQEYTSLDSFLNNYIWVNSSEVLVDHEFLEDNSHFKYLAQKVGSSRIWGISDDLNSQLENEQVSGLISCRYKHHLKNSSNGVPFIEIKHFHGAGGINSRDRFKRFMDIKKPPPEWSQLFEKSKLFEQENAIPATMHPLEYSFIANKKGTGLLHETLLNAKGDFRFYCMNLPATMNRMDVFRVHLRVGLHLRQWQNIANKSPQDFRQEILEEFHAMFPRRKTPFLIAGYCDGLPGHLTITKPTEAAQVSVSNMHIDPEKRKLSRKNAAVIHRNQQQVKYQVEGFIHLQFGNINGQPIKTISKTPLLNILEIHQNLTKVGIGSLMIHRIPSKQKIIIPSSYEYAIQTVREICRRLLRIGYPYQLVQDLDLVLDEAITNAVKWGNQLDMKKSVSFSYEANAKRIKFIIADQGIGFEPDKITDPLSEDGLESNHGRGLFLMQAYMDSVSHNKKGNILYLTKNAPFD